VRRFGPATRGTGFIAPVRSMAWPGGSVSMPASAVARRLD
jgi:hypothetical protein